MALAKNKVREHKIHQGHENVAPAKAGEVYYTGGGLCVDANGLAVPAADVAGYKSLGVATSPLFPDDPDLSRNSHLDNSAGLDGVVQGDPERIERAVRYDAAGEWAFLVAGAAAPKVGDVAYWVDDDTVSAENGVGLAAENGVVAGVFTRPAPHGGWMIDLYRRS